MDNTPVSPGCSDKDCTECTLNVLLDPIFDSFNKTFVLFCDLEEKLGKILGKVKG